ncbi:MAG TPA: hypothetical protein DCQ34_03370 [Chitinophagaceae bacterium]|nr:hypothetical protein [Chitinophagaceae bacterium]
MIFFVYALPVVDFACNKNSFLPESILHAYANAPVGYTFISCPLMLSVHVLQVLPTMKRLGDGTWFTSFNGSVSLMKGLF